MLKIRRRKCFPENGNEKIAIFNRPISQTTGAVHGAIGLFVLLSKKRIPVPKIHFLFNGWLARNTTRCMFREFAARVRRPFTFGTSLIQASAFGDDLRFVR